MLRYCGLIILALASASPCLPQESPVLRGTVLERDAGADTGQFSVRTASNQVLRFRFDAKTYAERYGNAIEASELHPGETVEVVADGSGSGLRYARTVHVLEPPDRSVPPRRPPRRYAPIPPPKGNLTFSGVIAQVGEASMVLRARGGPDQTIRLGEDTRYLADGVSVGPAELHPNMSVFVRGTRNVYGDLEASQVVWGAMLSPR